MKEFWDDLFKESWKKNPEGCSEEILAEFPKGIKNKIWEQSSEASQKESI